MDIERYLQFLNNHPYLIGGQFLVTVLLLHDLFDTLTRKYKVATPARAVELLNQDETIVIDVREPGEYAKGHIEGAHHIVLGRLKERIFGLNQLKDTPIIVYCQQGTRSKEACKQLVKEGYTQVYYLDGGLLSWQDQKLPLVKKNRK